MSSRNRVEILVGVGLLGLSVLAGLYILTHYRNGLAAADDRAQTAPPTATPNPVELWSGYEQALAVAQGQAADVQLVSATAQWQSPSEDALLAGSPGWAFMFYSLSQDKLFAIVVKADTATLVNQSQAGTTPAVLSGEKWQDGPRDATLVFLAHGARQFLETHPQAMVELHLAQHEEDYPTWHAVALDSQSPDTFALLLNAQTMQTIIKSP